MAVSLLPLCICHYWILRAVVSYWSLLYFMHIIVVCGYWFLSSLRRFQGIIRGKNPFNSESEGILQILCTKYMVSLIIKNDIKTLWGNQREQQQLTFWESLGPLSPITPKGTCFAWPGHFCLFVYFGQPIALGEIISLMNEEAEKWFSTYGKEK